MARKVQIKALDGKENTLDETLVDYPVGIPSDVLFFSINNTVYAQWWNTAIPPRLMKVPAYQLVSIE